METPPTIYEIRVAGHLSPQWVDWFEGLTITLEEDGNTLLTGPVADQAALHGLLKKVRDLGMSLLSVNQVPSTGTSSNQPIKGVKRMNTNNKLIEKIQDTKVTLSTLWVFVMFCIAYADIIGFITNPGYAGEDHRTEMWALAPRLPQLMLGARSACSGNSDCYDPRVSLVPS